MRGGRKGRWGIMRASLEYLCSTDRGLTEAAQGRGLTEALQGRRLTEAGKL